MVAIKPLLCKGVGIIHRETQTQWSLPNNPSGYKLYSDHKKTCTGKPQVRSTVTPHPAQQPASKVVANHLFSPIWDTHASFTLAPLSSTTHGVIWPFLTHENNLSAVVPIDIQIHAGYSTSHAWSSYTGLAVSDHQKRQEQNKIKILFNYATLL